MPATKINCLLAAMQMRESGEPAAEFSHCGEKGVRPA